MAVGQRHHGGTVRVGQRDAHLRRQAVGVMGQVPDQDVWIGIDDLDHPRPLEQVAERGVVALKCNANQVVVHRSVSSYLVAARPWLGKLPGRAGAVMRS